MNELSDRGGHLVSRASPPLHNAALQKPTHVLILSRDITIYSHHDDRNVRDQISRLAAHLQAWCCSVELSAMSHPQGFWRKRM
eukprot:1101330-Amphidinium_carterae.1